ncbi:thioredoxin-disulfide reductase [Actinokineospora sp. NBRC 105648]|uniref:thioredoxin-disulfide reductase n=1 Tax=Actinokineospora sp. NBRC 105648 TaxID=3032206 RepID=UPI0024A4D5E2|nr:thioredoxin-disulfide reductase [Actinokineospora sp. NBRC 105648]GLZ36935.1 thioredoxin reductase [Actinokineospora sp. NBRC 105648]
MDEVVVIGSGPAGYTAALYLARAQLAPLVFEGTVSGGALMTTTDVENFPGFPAGVMGPDLMGALREQALRFGAVLRTRDVVDVDLSGPVKTVVADGVRHRARAVVLAMGAQPRYLGVPGEAALLGRGVSSCATCDGFFFRGQDVAVVGGGDSAMEEALFLTRFARSVTVVHRRAEFRASVIMQERARANPRITWVTGTTVSQVRGTDSVTDVVLADGRVLPVTGLFVAIGHYPRSELVKGQLELDEDGYVRVQSPTTHTGLAGVFAAGDLVDRRYRQAITAAGSGCAAAIDAERWLAEDRTG